MIKPEHLIISTNAPNIVLRGGQHVGVTHYAVLATHTPTGLTASCHSERSNMKNRDIAISMLEWGLAEIGWKE